MKDNDVLVATVASFRNFPSVEPIKDSVVIFWESHTNNPTDKERIKSTIDLIYKRFDMQTCEKYEVRTGYLSRYNYLSRRLSESSIEELQEAVIKGEEEQVAWIERCNPEMSCFKQINWQVCVSERKNPYFLSCRAKLQSKIKDDSNFLRAYKESADAYAVKRHTNPDNGFSYLVEENAWILSLPYLYPNKKIYIIHVGNVTESTTILFSEFEYLRNSALLMFPSFSHETFANVGDFKLESEGKQQFGYFLDIPQSLITSESGGSSEDAIAERAEKEILSSIIAQLPGHIYWMNQKYKYLGCNDLQAKHLGLKSPDEIVGKTVFDLLAPNEAKKHSNINKLVIERGKSYSGKEKISSPDGKIETYLSTKVPLMSKNGTKVGLLGVSVNITDREEAIELRKQNEIKKYELEKQHELQDLAESVAHDIRTPLTVLLFIINKLSISEEERTSIKQSVSSIERIINELIVRYENKPIFTKELCTCLQTTIKEMIKFATYQYAGVDIDIRYVNDGSANGYNFIHGDHSDFCRMMSNLINNAIEAVPENRRGIVEVGFSIQDNNAVISIKDNGVGMSKDVAKSIMDGHLVESTKKSGHGLGTKRIFENIKSIGGSLSIMSEEGVGTTFKITCPLCETPSWFSDSIAIKKDGIVVVLDDDSSIFAQWKAIFSQLGRDVQVKYFTKGKDAVDYINSLEDKSKVFLITDYELRGQSIDGISVIEQTGMSAQNLLVTNIYTSRIKDFSKRSNIFKMFPKIEGIEKIKIVA